MQFRFVCGKNGYDIIAKDTLSALKRLEKESGCKVGKFSGVFGHIHLYSAPDKADIYDIYIKKDGKVQKLKSVFLGE